jgi:hypothetical protein
LTEGLSVAGGPSLHKPGKRDTVDGQDRDIRKNGDTHKCVVDPDFRFGHMGSQDQGARPGHQQLHDRGGEHWTGGGAQLLTAHLVPGGTLKEPASPEPDQAGCQADQRDAYELYIHRDESAGSDRHHQKQQQRRSSGYRGGLEKGVGSDVLQPTHRLRMQQQENERKGAPCVDPKDRSKIRLVKQLVGHRLCK